MRRERDRRAAARRGIWVWAVGAFAIATMGCHGEGPRTSPASYDGEWILSRQQWQKGEAPEPPSPIMVVKYRFDSTAQQYQVRWESIGQPDSPRELFNQTYSAEEVRPGVLRMGDPRKGFCYEYSYQISGDELTLEFVSGTVAGTATHPSAPALVIEADGGGRTEVDGGEVRRRQGPPGVMVLTRSRK